MRTGKFWEEGSSLCSPVQAWKKKDVIALLKMVPSHVANIDKNNGLI